MAPEFALGVNVTTVPGVVYAPQESPAVSQYQVNVGEVATLPRLTPEMFK